jgi:hypothetical protein
MEAGLQGFGFDVEVVSKADEACEAIEASRCWSLMRSFRRAGD